MAIVAFSPGHIHVGTSMVEVPPGPPTALSMLLVATLYVEILSPEDWARIPPACCVGVSSGLASEAQTALGAVALAKAAMVQAAQAKAGRLHLPALPSTPEVPATHPIPTKATSLLPSGLLPKG